MFALLALTLLADTPLSLEEAVAKASRTNPQVVAAAADAARAETVNHQALSQFYPQVDGRAVYQYNNEKVTFGITLPPGVTLPAGVSFSGVLQPWWTLNYQVTATENLALYGPALPLLDQAHSSTRAADDVAVETRVETAFATAQAYYAALEADALLTVSAESKTQAAELLRQTQIRREAGRATEAELLRARLQVAVADQGVASATRADLEARETLSDAVGEPGPFSLSRPQRPTPPPAPETEDAEGLTRRPDVAAAREAIVGAEDGKSAALRQFYPSLSLTGLYNSYDTSDGTLLLQPANHFAVIGTLDVLLFDGNLRYWQLREKREALRATKARADAATLAASADLRRTRRRLAAAREEETLAEERLNLAQRTAELVTAQYSLGTATQLELLDTNTALATARREASRTELETDLSVLDLRRALGLPLLQP